MQPSWDASISGVYTAIFDFRRPLASRNMGNSSAESFNLKITDSPIAIGIVQLRYIQADVYKYFLFVSRYLECNWVFKRPPFLISRLKYIFIFHRLRSSTYIIIKFRLFRGREPKFGQILNPNLVYAKKPEVTVQVQRTSMSCSVRLQSDRNVFIEVLTYVQYVNIIINFGAYEGSDTALPWHSRAGCNRQVMC